MQTPDAFAVRIIVTGGTFDKRYDEISGALTFGDSHLPVILRHARLNLPVSVEVTRLVDSLDMTDEDRHQVLAACRAASEERLVVIHGTDTMTKTAELLGWAGLPKTIVLTGAMVPYAVLGSDSVFNLGFALASAQLARHGVYIAMNGRLFGWDQVQKNRAIGLFEARLPQSTLPSTNHSGNEPVP